MLAGEASISKCICLDFSAVEGNSLPPLKEPLSCLYWFEFMSLSSTTNSTNKWCLILWWPECTVPWVLSSEGPALCQGSDAEQGWRGMKAKDLKGKGGEFIPNLFLPIAILWPLCSRSRSRTGVEGPPAKDSLVASAQPWNSVLEWCKWGYRRNISQSFAEAGHMIW